MAEQGQETNPPKEMAFGRFKVVIHTDGDVVLTRAGALCQGATRESRMWCMDQLEAALAAARRRRGEDAICEVRALTWAIEQVCRKRGGAGL